MTDHPTTTNACCGGDASADADTGGATRRTVLRGLVAVGATALAGTSVTATPARADSPTGDRIVALGLNGGPKLNAGQAKPALALVAGGSTYLVDCGYDTPNQMVKAGLTFPTLANLFVTHHHLDHTSGIPGVILHGWTNPQTLPSTVTLWGPPSTHSLLAGITSGFGEEIRLFSTGGGFPPFPTLRLPVHHQGHRQDRCLLRGHQRSECQPHRARPGL